MKITDNTYLRDDLNECLASMDLSLLEGKRVLITGATGLIGRSLITALLLFNEKTERPAELLALVRSTEKAERLFGSQPHLSYLVGDIRELAEEDKGVHYVIHGASMTSSRDFVTKPVETIRTAVDGTLRVLEFARKNPVESLLFLSSMEVYGAPATDEKIDEAAGTNLDTMKVRSAYPEAKRMCENLCASYASEYGVPVRVLRLTQTFGPGVEREDGRVFAEFARSAVSGADIILHTKGETKRCYLYTADAAAAILAALLAGKNGEAYNAANEATYCSIYEMAELAAESLGQGRIRVRIEEDERTDRGYAPVLRMNLDTEKLRALGWKPHFDLRHMFEGILAGWKG